MFGSAVLDTAIGLVFIFFVISTICSSVFSLIARIRQIKGQLLQQGLIYLLDSDMRDQLMNHPLVQDLSLAGNRFYDRWARWLIGVSSNEEDTNSLVRNPRPAYIPPEAFSKALIDIFIESANQKNLERALTRLSNAGFAHLEEVAQQRIRIEINRLLDEGEDVAVDFVSKLVDRFSEHRKITPDERERILQDVRDVCKERDDIMLLIDLGIQNLNLPERTQMFLRRHIELIMRSNRRGLMKSQENLETFTKTIEGWFNNSMDSLSGIFKQRAQMWLFVIATIITLVFNINAISIAQTLWNGPTIRSAVVQAAEARVEAEEADGGDRTPVEIFNEDLVGLGIPVGWTEQDLEAGILGIDLSFLPAQIEEADRVAPNDFTRSVGWLLTITAALFGAPFWFDVLNKIVNLRTEIKPKT